MKKIVFVFVLLLSLLTAAALAAGPELTFSLESGFYEYPMPLEITCDNDKATIYYTLDGSVPDENSLVYEGTLTLLWSNDREDTLSRITNITAGDEYVPTQDFPTGHVVRAIAITPNGKKSDVVSGTFMIGYSREELYGDTAVMFLVTDPEGLFDYDTGIYVTGRVYDEWAARQTEAYEAWQATANYTQRGDDWERPVSVTFLEADGSGFTQEMGLRIKGGASRGNTQKSLRLIARKDYGEKNVDYAVFPDNVREEDGGVVEKYKSFTLRNGGNDCDFSRIRDPLIANLATGLRFETAQNRPCIAFLNGEFWGIYTLNEEYTDNYIQYHYGIDNDNVITVKCGEVDDGEEEDIDLFAEMFDYIAYGDMSDPEKYARACELLDMGSFADYAALHLYIGNTDGPFQNNNWQMWRVREADDSHPYADGKWRMMLYDSDQSSGIYVDGGNGGEDHITPILTGTNYQGYHPALLLTSLIQSEEFQREFITACCDLQNLYFTAKRVKAEIAGLTEAYMPYVPDTWRRFGPSWVLWNPESHFQTELDQTGKFFENRANCFVDIVKKTLELGNAINITIKINGAGTVYINGRNIPLEGTTRVKYFSLCGLTVTAVPDEGATFTGWTASHDSVTIEDPAALTTRVDFSRVFTLTANFE